MRTPLGMRAPEGDELLGFSQEFDDFVEVFFCFFYTGNIFECDGGIFHQVNILAFDLPKDMAWLLDP